MNKDHDRTKNAVSSNRRQVVKATLAVPPILATLTSRPVQAVQGLSNMMSGNTSSCRGDEFYGGMSPGFWKNPGGTTDLYGDGTVEAWTIAGFSYGTLIEGKSGRKWNHYTGGTTYLTAFGSGSDIPLREILNNKSGSEEFHLIAGLLNARYFWMKAGGGRSKYFLTPIQFADMYAGVLPVPSPYTSLRNFIESNYHKTPGSDCGI